MAVGTVYEVGEVPAVLDVRDLVGEVVGDEPVSVAR
jgi:hypothetical protein